MNIKELERISNNIIQNQEISTEDISILKAYILFVIVGLIKNPLVIINLSALLLLFYMLFIR